MTGPTFFGRTVHRLMAQSAILDGVFAVHKPKGISSADVLRDLQRHFKQSEFWRPWLERETSIRQREARLRKSRRKVKPVEVKLGHGGTLDPMATGVLIVGAGRGTKELNQFLLCTKTYETVIVFGCATDTYDRVGKVVSKAPYEHITRELVESTLAQFRGHIMQRPSIYSALKQKGKKLYEYAREAIDPPFEIAKRPVEVSNLEILEWYPPGTHDFDWPSEEAGVAEKRAVSMVNKAGTPPDSGAQSSDGANGGVKRGAGDMDATSESEPVAKRAREEEQKGATQAARDAQAEATPTGSDPVASPEAPVLPADPAATQPEEPADASAVPPPSSASSMPKPGPPAVKITLTVSSGFYVRSFAHDLGLALGSNALMSELVRARQGDFSLKPEENILEYKDLEAGEATWAPKLRRFLDAYAAKTLQETATVTADAAPAADAHAGANGTKDGLAEERTSADTAQLQQSGSPHKQPRPRSASRSRSPPPSRSPNPPTTSQHT
ncbi:hypothetical protein KEM52_006228 [Ascosphaera acerosa]|nr:hypothetical protein KEM52_006228 [Ascosphaera acerosa]